jgi:hypothetical protein
MKDEPVHVGSGGFRVDRKRMLEKLAQFQFADETQYLASWLRAAVASGATSIRCEVHGGRFSLRFDGKPFGLADLQNVYDALFEEQAGSRGRRYLALGLVSALRGGRTTVSVTSGQGGSRHRFTAQSPLSEAVREHPEREADTVIAMEGRGAPKLSEVKAWTSRMGHSPVEVLVNGSGGPARASAEPDEPALWVSLADIRGFVRPLLRGKASRLSLFVYGVLAEDVEADLGPAHVHADLSCDELSLDASQAKVVRNERFLELQAFARNAARQLFSDSLLGHRRRLREAGKALLHYRPLLTDWREVFKTKEPARLEFHGPIPALVLSLIDGDLQAPPPPEVREAVRETAKVTRWLREASVRATAGWRSRRQKPSEALAPGWTASIFLDWKAKPLSLAELRSAFESDGLLRWSRQPLKAAESFFGQAPVLWLLSEEERSGALAAFGPDSLVDVSAWADRT